MEGSGWAISSEGDVRGQCRHWFWFSLGAVIVLPSLGFVLRKTNPVDTGPRSRGQSVTGGSSGLLSTTLHYFVSQEEVEKTGPSVAWSCLSRQPHLTVISSVVKRSTGPSFRLLGLECRLPTCQWCDCQIYVTSLCLNFSFCKWGVVDCKWPQIFL